MALTNVTQFNLGIDRFIEDSEEKFRKMVRIVGLEALRRLILATRVDTGRMRANWQVTEGQPAVGAVERFDQAGSMGTVDTLAVESRNVLAATGKAVIWIHNGVKYVGVYERKDKMLVGTHAAMETWIRSQR